MHITLNNREEEISGVNKLTVSELLEFKKFTFKFLVVKLNGELVKKGDYETTAINEGDQVMVLHLISGG